MACSHVVIFPLVRRLNRWKEGHCVGRLMCLSWSLQRLDSIFKLSNSVMNRTFYIGGQGFNTVPTLQQRGFLESREKTGEDNQLAGDWGGVAQRKTLAGGNYSTVPLPACLLQGSPSG